ncbi:hypothetical protein [Jiella sonneratiae]|uniref:Uncharacterized protein n=1 Tax=Jiella sonneratiae TaxID=2816856 RepID=A0ABS3J9B5_9HYPH|nr:hypothetical protein [Jiella sonneratiae]MBO0906271.1 hypothetical protein [Jiella sonneratiae]
MIEAQAKALVEKMEHLEDRELVHEAQNLYATIVSAIRVTEKRAQRDLKGANSQTSQQGVAI